MSLKVALCLCAVIFLGASAKRTRIVGGKSADITEFPFQVSLRLQGQHFCGGSIVTSKHVITAAHCVVDTIVAPFTYVRVYTGSSSSKSLSGPSYKIKRVDVHPEYEGTSESSYHNDIAIITLTEDIQFNEEQNKISLPAKDVSGGEKAKVSGWGLQKYTLKYTPVQLQKASMVIVDKNMCEKFIGKLYDEQICAMQKKGVGICSGDSGGPLTVDGKLVGIASFVIPCGEGYPDVYTKVYSYLDFIKSIVEN